MQIILDYFNFLIELWTRVADGIGIPVPLLSTLFVFGSGAVYALTRSVWKTAERIRQLEEKGADLQAILDNMPGDRTLWGALNKFSGNEELDIPGLLVMNLKGGVGKTTISGNLALSLAQLGKRVLLVDLDVQGSLSAALLSQQAIIHREARGHDAKNALGDLLEMKETPTTLEDHAFPVRGSSPSSADGRVYLIGADLGLSDSEDRLMFAGFREQRDVLRLLSAAIRAHNNNSNCRFDFVIFDGPPRFGLATANAMKAASHILIPTRPEQTSVRAVQQLIRGMASRQAELGHGLDLAGVVLNEASAQPGSAAERIIAELNVVGFRFGTLGDHVLRTRIPPRVIIGRPQNGMVYQDTGAAAVDVRTLFDSLRDEILNRMGVRQ